MVDILGTEVETSLENNKSNEYDEIVSLVGACGDNVGLPGELLIEILSKLPVKSLTRFKIVCKPWNLLINSPIFIDKHLHRKNPQIGFYSINADDDNEEIEVDNIEDDNLEDDNPFDNISYILGTCNGIICVDTHCDKSLILFNPSTREFSFLPKECFGAFYGFYYLSKTQKYHVVCYKYQPSRRRRSLDIQIWTLGKSILRRDVEDVTVPGYIDSSTLITCGTSLFWLGRYRSGIVIRNDMVICYDLIEVRFSEMNVPPSPPQSSDKFLGVLKDSVIMFVYPESEPKFFDIWMLIGDVSTGTSRTRYRKIGPLDTGVNMNPVDVCFYGKRILCSKDSIDNDYTSSNLFYYNLETGQVEDYQATHPPMVGFVNYVESLVPINSLVPCIDTKC